MRAYYSFMGDYVPRSSTVRGGRYVFVRAEVGGDLQRSSRPWLSDVTARSRVSVVLSSSPVGVRAVRWF